MACGLLVTDEVDLASMLHDAQGMVLHSRATANVAEHQDLDVIILGVLRRMVAGWQQLRDIVDAKCCDNGGEDASKDG